MEEQPETRRGDDEVAKPGAAVRRHVAEWSPGPKHTWTTFSQPPLRVSRSIFYRLFCRQHGRGTHVWILRQVEESQCFLSNQYTGDFVQGQRHGRGTFYHASGAFYEGEWCNNKSVSKVNPVTHHRLRQSMHVTSQMCRLRRIRSPLLGHCI